VPPDATRNWTTTPRVLFVYYSYTMQTQKVVDAMTDILRQHGCEVEHARIELTDARYAQRFSTFPLRRVYRDLFGMIPAQLRGATGEIQIPDAATHGGYDLVCIGSPTWWMKTCLPIRSYLKSGAAHTVLGDRRFAAFVVCRRYWGFNLRAVRKLGEAQGGEYVGGTHWAFAGGQIKSLLALLSYLGHGENRVRYLGFEIPPTNLQADDLEDARSFASGLAAGITATRTRTEGLRSGTG
jgi:menaquinone-dependent protoporphyrinogen IX oxidase